MKLHILTGGAATVLAIVGVAIHFAPADFSVAPKAPDPVLASFERALNHVPGPISPVRRESIEHDELYEAFNRVHWTRNDTVAPTATTPTSTTGGTDDEEDER